MGGDDGVCREQSALDQDTYVWADGMGDFSQVKSMQALMQALMEAPGTTSPSPTRYWEEDRLREGRVL